MVNINNMDIDKYNLDMTILEHRRNLVFLISDYLKIKVWQAPLEKFIDKYYKDDEREALLNLYNNMENPIINEKIISNPNRIILYTILYNKYLELIKQ